MHGIIDAIVAAFDAYEPRKIDDVFLNLHKCLESSMKDHGENNYSLPHLHKNSLRNQGKTRTNVLFDPAVYNLATNLLSEPNL